MNKGISQGPIELKLDNGLTVLLDPVSGAPVVSVQAWVQVGSADEAPEEAGLAHIHEHMIFKGTPTRPVGRIASEIESAGGDINAFTSFDYTVYYITIANRYSEQAVQVLADALGNALFDAAELSRELEVIQEEILRGRDNPQTRLSDLQFSSAFGVHPYGRPIIGTPESVASCTRERVLDFFGRWYVPSNIYLVVSGEFDPSGMERVICDSFGKWPRAAAPAAPARPTEPERARPGVKIDVAPVAEGYMSLGYPMPGIHHPDTPALDVLALILGSGESSRLFREVRDARQLAYGIWAQSYSPKDPGLFLMGAVTRADKLRPCLEAMLEQIGALEDRPVTTEELDKAKKIVEAELIFDGETVQGMARKLGLSMSLSGSMDFEQRYLNGIRSVEREDLMRVASHYLSPHRAVVVGLWPQAAEHPLDDRDVLSVLDDAPRVKSDADRIAPQPPEFVPAARAQRKTGEHDVVYRALESGLILLAKRRPAVPVVNLRAALLGGQRHESADLAGIQNFTANMLTKGTKNHSAQDIAAEVDRLAGSLHGFSGRNSLGLTADFMSVDFEQGLDLFTDVLLNPTFDDDEVEKKRQEILFALSRRRDQPNRMLFDLFARTLFGDHAYSYPTLGSVEVIESLEPDDLAFTWEEQLCPKCAVIGLVGDIDPESALDRLERAIDLTGIKDRQPKDPAPAPAVPTAPRSASQTADKEQAHIVIGFPGCTVYDEDRYTLEMLSSILSGQSGRLFLDLRDAQGLAYAVTSLQVEGLDPGFIGVYIGTAPDKVGHVIAEIDRHLELMRSELVTPEELARAKRYILGSFEIELQTGSSWTSHLVLNELYGLPRDEIERMTKAIEATEPEDILRVARRFLDPNLRVQAVLEPEKP